MRRKSETAGRQGQNSFSQRRRICFFDRERESHRIEEAFLKKESLLISGPADIGKTALMRQVIRNLSGDLASKCIYLPGFKDPHHLLQNLIRALYETGSSELRRQLKAKGVSRVNFETWLKTLPSARLKGILYRAAQSGDYRIILDHVPLLTYARAKIIKELFWMRETPVYLLMRDDEETRIAQFVRFFYWRDRQCMTLGPLPETSASELLEACIEKFQLAKFDLEEFRDAALGLSGCVPGAIVKMCALAADPRYQHGAHIKTKLIHIDYLMNGATLVSPAGRENN
jgi:hypothetical protein